MNALSLFDGISCGKVAFQRAGIPIEKYFSYEIDKYAIKVSESNYPEIIRCGDVFDADFTQYEGIDYLIGGSPCTYWSIAQKYYRETEASGMGWELFQQYVRAIREAKPKYFLYENNKSMSKQIRASIDEAFGFEAILINSALVSAQTRQRLYWVGKRNADGTYSKVDVEQPEDRGILLRDILESGTVDKEKSYVLKHQAGNARDYFKKHHMQVAFGPVRVGALPRPNGELSTSQAMRIYSVDGKSVTLSAGGGGLGGKTGLYAVPVSTTEDGKAQTIKAQYQKTSVANIVCYSSTYGASGVAVPVNPLKNGKGRCVTSCYSCKGANHVLESNYSDDPNKQKWDSVAEPVCFCSEIGCAIACEFDENGNSLKAICQTDGKTYNVHLVREGVIELHGKYYPISLPDGYWIIRKLTVAECCRLQTLPDDYCRAVSDSQAYKGIGNGWTVEVIAHIFTYLKGE